MPKKILAYGIGNLDIAANALSSTANFLKAHGWRAGAGYQPGEPNFAAIQEWNAAGVYQKAIALMGRQIDGGSEELRDFQRPTASPSLRKPGPITTGGNCRSEAVNHSALPISASPYGSRLQGRDDERYGSGSTMISARLAPFSWHDRTSGTTRDSHAQTSSGSCVRRRHRRHPRLRRPLRRRFQHLRGEHIGGGAGRRHFAGRDRRRSLASRRIWRC